jgi:glutamyl-tRNA synthetase
MGFFYDELFNITDNFPEGTDIEDVKKILSDFAEQFDVADDQNAWFDKIKATAEKYGYASDMKAYKASPESFKGSVADVSSFLRLAVTGRLNSPDMYEVMHILGAERVKARLTSYASEL